MLEDFPDAFSGPVLYHGQVSYEKARSVYNARTGKQPAVIAQARTTADVVTLVRYAAEQQLPLAVRCGGHGVDGTAMPDGALVLDLTAFKGIAVDDATSRVRLGAGVLMGQMDAALHEHGLVVPTGTVSTTGIAGLTLGGGVGYNMRRYGATVDNVISCEVVTTDGRLLRASEDENPDLFWSLRGGGGNFGVVTTFEYQGRPMLPVVSAGMIPYTHDKAAGVLRALREYMPTAPRELAVIGALTPCPPLPPVPAEMHGKDALMVVVVYTGPQEQSETVIRELITVCGAPAAVAVQPVPWPVANSMLDAIAPYGRRVYAKGAYLPELSDDAIEVGVKHAATAPRSVAPPLPSTVQNFWSMGGAISDDFTEDSCAFSREGATWFWEVATQWDDADDDEKFMTWADGLYTDLKPHVGGNGYINLTNDMGPQWRKGVWGSPAKYQRLLDAKTKWDPENMLRYNKNIDPRDVKGAA
jgi:hypothetical protein